MILITPRKKHTMVFCDNVLETKGIAPAKKDLLPIARYATSRVMAIIREATTCGAERARLCEFISKIMNSVKTRSIWPVQEPLVQPR